MSRLKTFFGFTCIVLLPLVVRGADDDASKRPDAPKASRRVKFVRVESGEVLGVENDSEDSGTPAKIVKDAEKEKENAARQWKLVKAGSFYKIVNAKSNNVLDVSNESTDEDGSIIVWDDKPDADGNDNQRWSLDPKADAKAGEPEKPRRIKSKSSNLVFGRGRSRNGRAAAGRREGEKPIVADRGDQACQDGKIILMEERPFLSIRG
jgi:Ricin-type beta-trefoil lectin domain-like